MEKHTIQQNKEDTIRKEDVLVPLKRVEKPWGHEQYLHVCDKWAFKLLNLKKGHRFSLQYHEKKEEAQHLLSGKLLLTLGSKERPEELTRAEFLAGETIHLLPGTIHQAEALEDSVIVEVSTPELLDVVRLKDDYAREGTNKP